MKNMLISILVDTMYNIDTKLSYR